MYLPSWISSATPLPAAGDCCSPWPENPLHSNRLEKFVCAPIIPFYYYEKKLNEIHNKSQQTIRHNSTNLVEGIVLIKSWPEWFYFKALKSGNSIVKGWPNEIIKHTVIWTLQCLIWVTVRVIFFRWTDSAQECAWSSPLGAKPRHRRIDS